MLMHVKQWYLILICIGCITELYGQQLKQIRSSISKDLNRIDDKTSLAELTKIERRIWDEIGEVRAEFGESDTTFIRCYRLLTEIAYKRKDARAALRYARIDSVLSMQVIQSYPVFAINSLYTLTAAYRLSKNKTGEENCLLMAQQLIETYLPASFIFERIQAQFNIGDFYYEQNKFSKAKPILEQVYQQLNTLPDPDIIMFNDELNLDLSLIYEKQGNYEKALSLKQDRIRYKIRKHGLFSEEVLKSYTGYISSAILAGQYTKADSLIQVAHRLFGRTPFAITSHYIDILNAEATLQYKSGRLYSAEKSFDKLLAILKNLKHIDEFKEEYLFSVNNYAALSAELKRYDKAIDLFKEVTIAIKDVSPHSYWVTVGNLATAYEKKGYFYRADSLMQLVINQTINDNSTDFIDKCRYLQNLSVTRANQGKWASADSLFELSRARWASQSEKFLQFHPNKSEALEDRGYYKIAQADFQAADSLFTLCNQIRSRFIAYNFVGMSETDQAQLLEQLTKGVEAHFSLPANQVAVGKLFNYRLQLQGLLLEGSRNLQKYCQRSPDTLLKRKYQQWKTLKEKVLQLYTIPATKLKAQGINLDSIENVLVNTERELSSRSNVFADAFAKAPQWNDIQQTLKPYQAVVEIVRYRKWGIIRSVTDSSAPGLPTYNLQGLTDTAQYCALILTATGVPRRIELPNSHTFEPESLQYYLERQQNRLPDSLSYSHFWATIDTALPAKIKTVYFVPGGIYNLINPQTLRTATGFVFNQYEVRSLISSRTLLQTANKDKENIRDLTAAIFGDPEFNTDTTDATERNFIAPLPGARAEAKNIAKILGNKTSLYIGGEATEAALKRVNSPHVLHIATHGLFTPSAKNAPTALDSNEAVIMSKAAKDPMLRSMLLLANAADALQTEEVLQLNPRKETEDGILTAYEAQNLALDGTELVVLSACESGKGEVSAGEGVYGLQRAFISAGAKNVILSLWRVDDNATQLLMTALYENWRKSNNLRKAFRKAQESVQKIYPHPYYWGAFVLIGA